MSEQPPPYFSVIIVGAGPTGLATGNLLGLLGIDVLILERNVGLSDIPKAIAIDDEGLRICQAMRLDHAVIENVLLDLDAHYISGKHYISKVAPTGKRNGYPLISTFHQPELEATLLHGLKRFSCVSIQFQHNVESFQQRTSDVVLSVRDSAGNLKTYACAYLLACDGAKSAIRRQLGIRMRGSAFAQKWLVVDTINDSDPTTTIVFFCNPKRPSVTVPAPHSCRRWEFMLLPGEKENEFLHEDNIRSLIRQVGGSHNPQISRRQIYTFHAAIAETFSKGRVFLLGDAAHLMPPFGGQGMNCGLRDAYNLSWKLQKVIQGQARPALLETYNQESHKYVDDLIGFSKFLGRIIMPTSKTIALLRDSIFFTLNMIPPIRKHLSQGAIKPLPRYDRGFLFVDGSKASKSLAGLMLPQPEVKTTQGQTTLLDNVLGQDFALLRIGHKPEEAFTSLERDEWQQLGAQFIAIDNEIEGFPANQRDLFILVRPDRYIYGVFTDGNELAFILTLRKHLASIIHTQK